MLAAAVALVPVVLFLGLLVVLDSFKLVRGTAVAFAICCGAAAAAVAIPLTRGVEAMLHLSPQAVVRYAGPVIEETLKLLPIAFLLGRRRVGFLVDAGVLGFATGAGFALAENLVFLGALDRGNLSLWLVRGVGTAILHDGTTSVAAMLAKQLVDAAPARLARALLAGLATAAVLHSAYNHLLLPPVMATLVLLIVFPLLVLVLFERSEAATREWVGAGLDLDVELLDLLSSEAFHGTRFGRYLAELRERFPGPVVVDMSCLLRLELELAVQAKALLITRKAGLDMPVHPDVTAGLRELDHLRASIGPTGLLALKPLHVTSHRDDWHRYLVAETHGARWWVRLIRRV